MRTEADWFHLVDLKAKSIQQDTIIKKRVKVVCTIGPSSEEPEVMQQMIRNGMDVARLNFSHGDPEDHEQRINNLRMVAKQEGKFLGILQDIQGPKIRIGRLRKKEAVLKSGQVFTITTDDI
jgi:pyruvate kinase